MLTIITISIIRSWKGYQLVVKLLLGPSYGIVIKEIVDEIQQDNIGLYNDVEYLLSLTATMRALLYELSLIHISEPTRRS